VKFLKKIILAINIVLVVALLMSYLSPGTDPNENWVYALFGVFYPLILMANILMMIVWMLIDFKYLFVSLIAIVLGWGHLTSFVNIRSATKDTADLKVMSYNIKGVSGKYPDHHLLEIKNKGVVIYSKYPIVDSGVVEFGTRTNSCIYADVKSPAGTVRIYNLHLQSNSISKDADEVLDNGELDDAKAWSSVVNILSKYRKATMKRSAQAAKVKIHAESSPHPVMIVGDVNDPPTSHCYSTLAEGMQDAFHCKGSGIGTTYGGSIPMLRIDYILADEDLEVLTYTCRKEQFSDHYPIFAEVGFN